MDGAYSTHRGEYSFFVAESKRHGSIGRPGLKLENKGEVLAEIGLESLNWVNMA